MICCAFLSALIGVPLWFAWKVMLRQPGGDRSPLAWRLYERLPIEEPALARHVPFTLSARHKSVTFAAAGLHFMLRHEHNAWVHAAATILVVVAGLAFELTLADWRWIIVAVLWVWFAEAVNTAFEHLCDVVSPGVNESVRIAKDVAAGAVLVSAIGAALLGAVTLLPYISDLTASNGIHLLLCRPAP